MSRITKERNLTRDDLTRDWFRDWFGEEYLTIYPHRGEMEAREAVELYLSAVPPPSDVPVLDLACGAGRHLRELEAAGLAGVGLDLSTALLRKARSASGESPLVRGDMRVLPFADRSFGGVTSFFTSFGYFADPADDRRVLEEMRRVLRDGGSFMLDFLNAERVRRSLVPEDVLEVAGARIVQQREIREGYVVKFIRFQPAGGGAPREFGERVRLYTPAELTELLRSAGFVATHRYGDYAGGPVDTESPRLILAGRAIEREREER